MVLVVHLRDRVRPALRRRRADHELAVLAVRRRAVAVHVGGRRDDHVRVERERHRARRVDAGDVDLERRERAAVARDLLRREVHDRVAAVEGRAQRSPLGAVEHLELEAAVVQERLHVRHRAVREVVDADDLVVLRKQPLAQMRADEACGSGHSDLLHGTLLLGLGKSLQVMPPPCCSAGSRSRIPGTTVFGDADHGLAADDLRVDVRGRREREPRHREHLGQPLRAADEVHRLGHARPLHDLRDDLVVAQVGEDRARVAHVLPLELLRRALVVGVARVDVLRDVEQVAARPSPDRPRASSRPPWSAARAGR